MTILITMLCNCLGLDEDQRTLVFYALIAVAVISGLQGLYLAFQASVLLGLICVCMYRALPAFGVAFWFTHVDLPKRIVMAFPQILG